MEVSKDTSLSRIKTALEQGTNCPFGFTWVHGKLFYKGRYVLAKSSPFILVLLQEYQDSPLGGHGGEVKTYLSPCYGVVLGWYAEASNSICSSM